MRGFVIFVQCLCNVCAVFVRGFSAQKACNSWVVQGVQGIARVCMCAYVCACARTRTYMRVCECKTLHALHSLIFSFKNNGLINNKLCTNYEQTLHIFFYNPAQDINHDSNP